MTIEEVLDMMEAVAEAMGKVAQNNLEIVQVLDKLEARIRLLEGKP